jgi:NAD(P)-dependent dehydrogenase (short-subunit alcohol dehydrogenase family)
MGFETCRQLGRLGYHIILTARDRGAGESAAEKLVREGLAIEPFRLDLTRADDIAALVAHVNRHAKRIDVLVNNAGVYLEIAGSTVGARTSAFAARMDVVRAILESNLLGPFALSQGLIGAMRERGYGSVVNLSSAMGQLSDMGAGAPGYRMACVGINAMTKFFAEELRGTNILVNSVDPGWVRKRSAEATRSVEEGVAATIWVATLPDGGPSGQFFRDKAPITW